MDDDFTAPVAGLHEEASVSLIGPSRDRVRLSVGVEGGDEEFYLNMDAKKAMVLAIRMARASLRALGMPGKYNLYAVEIAEHDDEPKGEVVFEAKPDEGEPS